MFKTYSKIPEYYECQEYLFEKIIEKINTFYWEYRHRDVSTLKKIRIRNKNDYERIQDSLKFDYEVKRNSKFHCAIDSIKISQINPSQGIYSCIPSAICFNYLIFVKNDSIQLVDNYESLDKFILPVDCFEKAIFVCLREGYDLTEFRKRSGFYKINNNTYELIMEKLVQEEPLKKGKYKIRKNIVHLLVDSEGKIQEKIIKEITDKVNFLIII